ncbi:MAG TPA: DUF2721 domain-containing protein, partial [Gemmatimonadales bacterium]|nr:DUF2721 domain-containing protein [Gemmatimonadales bacterium]
LSGVGVTLTVLTNRMARIIDRARVLEDRMAAGTAIPADHDELDTLSVRARLIQHAITLSTCCALLICVVIVILFLRTFLPVNLAEIVALLFIVAMLAFIGALGSFLREIFVGTAGLRFGHRHQGKPGPPR